MIDDEMDYLDKRKLTYDKFLKENAIVLKLGETYLQESDSWAKKHYKIIFNDGEIALGIVVWCGIYNSTTKGCGYYDLFKCNTGEKYQDCRLEYALKYLRGTNE